MATPVEHEIRDLEDLLDHLEGAARENLHVRVETMLNAVGARSFAPIILLVGVMIASPLSGIPAFPSLTALIVMLVSLQMLMGRSHFWLPRWILHRTLPREKLIVAIKWSRPTARFIDYFLKPRLLIFVTGLAARTVTALVCLVIAAVMPLLEFIPLSSSLAGVALATFALALVANDGLVALIAYIAAGATISLGVYGILL